MKQQQDEHPQHRDVRSSQMFYNIADQDMSQYFLPETNQESEVEQKEPNAALSNSSDYSEEPELGAQDGKEVVSRLQIEIQKNRLKLVPVYGQIFIMLFQVQLVGQSKSEGGVMLVTNYRLCFFKKRVKKVDLPFGFISWVKFTDKADQMEIFLKYHHFWKFQVLDHEKYKQVTIFIQLYLKFNTHSSCFALSYALKVPQGPIQQQKHPSMAIEFNRLAIDRDPDLMMISNPDCQISDTYPPYFFIPISKSLSSSLNTLACKWNGNRIPIVTYRHCSISKVAILLWRSSYLMVDRSNKLSSVAHYLQKMKGQPDKLQVFDVGFKGHKKCIQEFEVSSICEVQYLDQQPLQAVKVSYEEAVQCFLTVKKGFIRDILASKWYDMVLEVLAGALRVKNSISMQKNTLLKCLDGRERSAQISALAQLILEPYYRTLKGFSVLVEKEFRWLGYPFRKRLGLGPEQEEQIPIFIQFLDCVSQLLHMNRMSFQFNFKYLSKLSNLMYTCLFGTFITNSPKEWHINDLEAKTVPIWDQLLGDLTTNAFFQSRNGELLVPTLMSEVRVWKEHFWYLTTAPKETYRLHPFAEDNQDYVSLNCLRFQRENKQLEAQVEAQRKVIINLRKEIEERKNNTLK